MKEAAAFSLGALIAAVLIGVTVVLVSCSRAPAREERPLTPAEQLCTADAALCDGPMPGLGPGSYVPEPL